MNMENVDTTEVNRFFDKLEKSEDGGAMLSELKQEFDIHTWDANHYDRSFFCNNCGSEFAQTFMLALPVRDSFLIICQDCLEEKPGSGKISSLWKEMSRFLSEDLDYGLNDLEDLKIQVPRQN